MSAIKHVLMLGMFIIWAVFATHLVSAPSIRWMDIYFPEDFQHLGAGELLDFLRNLRVPIPLSVGLVEIWSVQATGSTAPVTTWLYRFSLLAPYLIALAIAASSQGWWRLGLTFVAGSVFLYVTTLVHPGNPQDYDTFMPMFFMACVAMLGKARSVGGATQGWGAACWALGAGFFLAMTELSRPFVVFILPIMLVLSFFVLGRDRRLFGMFLLPIVLTSGVWHAHLWLTHGQFTFSNHAGFNLARAWPEVAGGVALQPELHDAPLKEGRWANLNTEEHARNSEALKKAITRHWIRHPGKFLKNTWKAVRELVSGRTAIYGHVPKTDFAGLYSALARATALFLFLNMALLLFFLFKGGRWRQTILSSPDSLVITFTFLSLVFLAIGEKGEEARFLISLLPMLAVWPSAVLFREKPSS